MRAVKNKIANLFYLLLLTIPVSFKVELVQGLILYPQEIIMAFLLILYLFVSGFKLPFSRVLLPYYYQLLGLLIVTFSTLFSFFYFFDMEGILKVAKYCLYILSIIIVFKSTQKDFLTKFNTIALITVFLTLSIFLFNFLTSGVSWSSFMHQATWDINKMPTGFSNLVFNFKNLEFVRYTGNHGIYGSYLVLVYLINISLILKKEAKKRNYLLLFLTVANLFLLTSREALLIFLIVNFFGIVSYLTNRKIKLSYLALGTSLIVVFCFTMAYLWVNQIDFVILNKIQYTIDSIQNKGEETNVSLRVGVWKVTLFAFMLSPINLLLGFGYNEENFSRVLTETSNKANLNIGFASVPESYFNTFLAYGGVFALLFGTLFFLLLLRELYNKKYRKTIIGKLFLFFTFALFLSNNTGASILADLLLSQFGLTYLWLTKNCNE